MIRGGDDGIAPADTLMARPQPRSKRIQTCPSAVALRLLSLQSLSGLPEVETLALADIYETVFNDLISQTFIESA